LLCGAAYAIFRTARGHDFGLQFGLAVSLAGQALFIFGLSNEFRSETTGFYLAIAAFQAALTFLMPNAIHRLISSAGAVFALSLGLSSLGLYGLVSGLIASGFALIWMNPKLWLGKGDMWRPIGYGLALVLMQMETTRMFGFSALMWSVTKGIDWWMHYAWWVNTALVTAVLVWAVKCMLAQQTISVTGKTGLAAILAAIVIGALSLVAPGIATAMLILLVGFAVGNRILMGLGLFALLVFLSHYYYQLQTTLLVKSAVLAASGAVLLIGRFTLKRMFQAAVEEGTHA
jgi:hypothetical protein